MQDDDATQIRTSEIDKRSDNKNVGNDDHDCHDEYDARLDQRLRRDHEVGVVVRVVEDDHGGCVARLEHGIN